MRIQLAKPILRLIIISILTVIITESTVFGWKLFSKSSQNCKPSSLELPLNLKSHVEMLSSKIGIRDMAHYDNLMMTASYITECFEKYGYTVYYQEYNVDNKKVKNIIVQKPGNKKPEEVIIIGAHYDSFRNPGADDNASGVAGLLELARMMADKNSAQTLRFIAFVNEEPPFFQSELMGSKVYAREAKAKGEQIKAMICLEMIGCYSEEFNSQRYPIIAGIFFPNKGNYIGVIGNSKSKNVVKKVVGSFKKHSNFPIESTALDFIPTIDFSDHGSFWDEGFSAVMITDLAFLRNKHYHLSTDTFEKLNYISMSCVIEGLYGVIQDYAQ